MKDGAVREINHKPDPFNNDRGEVIGGYWVAVLHNDEKMMGTMSRKRIDEIKSRSEAVKAKKGSPWDTDPEEMMKKTIVNAAFKELPKTGISDDVLRSMETDSELDNEEFKEWKRKLEFEHKSDLEDDGPPDDDIQDVEVIEEPVPEKEPEQQELGMK